MRDVRSRTVTWSAGSLTLRYDLPDTDRLSEADRQFMADVDALVDRLAGMSREPVRYVMDGPGPR